MNKHQKKYSNTAIKMNQALIALMEKQTFDSITIKALCEKAGVNRSTFYSHYQNLTELLEDTHRYIINLFVEEYREKDLSIEHYRVLSDDFLVPYLQVFSRYRHIFLITDFQPASYQLSRENLQLFEEITVPLCRQNGITDLGEIRYLARYYTAGCHAVIMQWLEGGCTESIPYICNLIRFCILGPLQTRTNHDKIEKTVRAEI